MKRKRIAAAMLASALALLGLSSGASASATVDLIWIDTSDPACLDAARRDCRQLGSALSSAIFSDVITLAVLITAGPKGVLAASVSVDYGDALPILNISGFGSLTTPPFLPLQFPTTTRIPPFIDGINAVAFPANNEGIGLPPGQSAYLGTVSFHKGLVVGGEFEIAVGTNGPGETDDIISLDGAVVTATTAFNGATLFDLPSQCPFRIEINTLRTNGKTVRAGPDETADVTAKARIVKGLAPSDTTLDVTLAIDARDGGTLIGSSSSGFEAIRLAVGNKGVGDKLAVPVPQCSSGFIDFTATFVGEVDFETTCRRSRTIRRECR